MERTVLITQLRDILAQAKDPKNKIEVIGVVGSHETENAFDIEKTSKRNQLIADAGYALSLAESPHEDYKDMVEFSLLDTDFIIEF